MGQTNIENCRLVKIFYLTIPDTVNKGIFDTRGAFGIDISTWCKSQGLTRDVDFD
ncbi:hypothetical protein UFOVP116_64 [uncultured Caudovirales phage]|uniref:Uncharacterized protein n=1 Tax=uncultured Caudovirales phage TaxID=2100421 RepID=A0A6J5L5F1_9CAUD|nr:hypothetical protein UFOVP116_64 [uncultured Caudovirales phage]